MGDLFLGGEMGAFIPSDSTVKEETTAGRHNSNFARCHMFCDKSSNYCEGRPSSTVTDGWIHFDMCVRASGSGSTAHKRWVWLDGSGTERIKITHRYDTDAFTLQYDIGAGFVTAGSSITLDLEDPALQTFDIHCVVNSASGSLNLYIAGTKRIESGTIDLSAITALDKFRFYGGSVSTLGFGTYVSQVAVSTNATIGKRVMTGYMSNTGSTDQWTNSYTSVDETVFSDTDYIYSAAANEVETFSMTLVGSMTGYTAQSVAVTARARKAGSGPQNLRLALRSGSTNFFSASDQVLDAGYLAHFTIWSTDPNTSAAWTAANVALAQPGVKSIA